MAYNQNYPIAMTVFFFLSFLALPSTSSLPCKNSTDCQALLKFKQAITSDPDGHLQAWNETVPFCNWTGITCHQQLKNRVMAIELTEMLLQGVISPYISNLSHLDTISLQGNSFHGGIPAAIGELSELTFMNLSRNNLGDNSLVSLQGCWSMETLDLDNTNLSGSIPAVLGQMTNLTYLSLSRNSLTGAIPSFLSNLTKLTNLGLQVNYFTGRIPKEIGALTKLEMLYLHTNLLEGSIPASISNCTALRQITLLENQITGKIPEELGTKLHNMQRLYFNNNQLSGKIPVTLSNLSQLILLDLSVNQFEGEVPQELGKLKKLEILYLHSNNLVSSSNNSSLIFLTPLSNCSHLQKLHLGSCLFAGSLPASIGSLSKDLYYLNLRNNKITGGLPAEIGNLSGLVTLDLWYNFFN